MAVHKAKRSIPSAQLTTRRRTHQQNKPQLFDTLHHLNRGYGIALINLARLEQGIFPHPSLRSLRNRTEELRASANHELLAALAGREQRDALRFGRLHARSAKPSTQVSIHK